MPGNRSLGEIYPECGFTPTPAGSVDVQRLPGLAGPLDTNK
jgi:hypothetical protein